MNTSLIKMKLKIWKQGIELAKDRTTFEGFGMTRNSYYFIVDTIPVTIYIEDGMTIYHCCCKQHSTKCIQGNVLCSYTLAAIQYLVDYLKKMEDERRNKKR